MQRLVGYAKAMQREGNFTFTFLSCFYERELHITSSSVMQRLEEDCRKNCPYHLPFFLASTNFSLVMGVNSKVEAFMGLIYNSVVLFDIFGTVYSSSNPHMEKLEFH